MHLGRLTKEVVAECDDPFGMTSELERIADGLGRLSEYVRLRITGIELAEQGLEEKSAAAHRAAAELLEERR